MTRHTIARRPLFLRGAPLARVITEARETRMTPELAKRLGWRRVDARPWSSKLTARWLHESGWTLEHCGHATALWPWDLHDPEGVRHLAGALQDDISGGYAWASLALAMGLRAPRRCVLQARNRGVRLVSKRALDEFLRRGQAAQAAVDALTNVHEMTPMRRSAFKMMKIDRDLRAEKFASAKYTAWFVETVICGRKMALELEALGWLVRTPDTKGRASTFRLTDVGLWILGGAS